MPNNITNRLIIKADNQQVEKVLDFLKGKPYDDGTPQYIDFNKITPMPKALDIDSSTLGEEGMRYLLAKSKTSFRNAQNQEVISHFESLKEELKDEALKLGRTYLNNISVYGFENWYGWCIKNWGSKWNAYEQDFEAPNIICFKTAWDDVTELIKKLSFIFPDVEFHYAYADENTGYNTGIGTIKNGVANIHHPEDESNEAYELAFELNPEDEECYELTKDGYKNIEEDEEEEDEDEDE